MTEVQAARAVLGCIEKARGPAMRASLAGGLAETCLHIEGADFTALMAAMSAYHLTVHAEVRAMSCPALDVASFAEPNPDPSKDGKAMTCRVPGCGGRWTVISWDADKYTCPRCGENHE